MGIFHYIKLLAATAESLLKQSEKASTPDKKKRIGWSDDEMILSLDLYFRTPYNKRTRSNPEIIELIGEFDYVINPVVYYGYKLALKGYKFVKKIRK